MKDLTSAYGDLLQDKRIRAEQSKYEALSRQRNTVLSRFKKTYQAFLDIWAGLEKAQQFYTEMKETAESLEKNVETFVSNRRVEGASLLTQIEQRGGSDVENQRGKLLGMMERVSLGSGDQGQLKMQQKRPTPLPNINPHQSQPSAANHGQSPPGTPRYTPHQYGNYHPTPTPPPPPPPASAGFPGYPQYPMANNANGFPRRDSYGQIPPPRRDSYQPANMQRRDSNQALPSSPPPTGGQQHQPYQPSHYSSPPNMYAGQVYTQQYNPSTYIPPPPPPGPPPPSLSSRQSFSVLPQSSYQPPPHPPTPSQPPQGYHQYPQQGQQQQQQQQQQQDPWAGLAGWR